MDHSSEKDGREESPGPGKRGKRGPVRIAKILLFNLVIFSALLLAGEAYMRLTGMYIVMDVESINKELEARNIEQRIFAEYTINGRRLVPNTRSLVANHRLSGKTVEMRINSLGFRGDEVPPRKAGQIRVLVLGDSITLGSYVPEEETYPAFIRERLAGLMAGADPVVINAGIVDVGIREETRTLKESGLAADPDLVVVGFYLNDLRPPFGFPGEDKRPGFLRRHSVLAQWIFRTLEMRRFIENKGLGRFDAKEMLGDESWKTDRAKFNSLIERTSFDWGSAWRDEEWEIVDSSFEKLARMAEKEGFEVLVAAFPVRFQVEASFIEDRPQKMVREKALANGFAFIDLLPLFRESDNAELFYDHCHLTPAGNEIAGDAIARKIADMRRQ